MTNETINKQNQTTKVFNKCSKGIQCRLPQQREKFSQAIRKRRLRKKEVVTFKQLKKSIPKILKPMKQNLNEIDIGKCPGSFAELQEITIRYERERKELNSVILKIMETSESQEHFDK